MWLKKGTKVVTVNGDSVGDIDRVVIDPRSKEVTHIVVNKGLLFPEDKVIPIDAVAASEQDRVVLHADVKNPDVFPSYKQKEYVDLDQGDWPNNIPLNEQSAMPLYSNPSVGAPSAFGPSFTGLPSTSDVPVDAGTRTEENIPPNTVALKEGAKVISAQGEHVGDLERVVVGPNSNLATHFVVSQGLLSTEKKIIPVDWIREISEGEVRLEVGSRTIDRLPRFDG